MFDALIYLFAVIGVVALIYMALGWWFERPGRYETGHPGKGNGSADNSARLLVGNRSADKSARLLVGNRSADKNKFLPPLVKTLRQADERGWEDDFRQEMNRHKKRHNTD